MVVQPRIKWPLNFFFRNQERCIKKFLHQAWFKFSKTFLQIFVLQTFFSNEKNVGGGKVLPRGCCHPHGSSLERVISVRWSTRLERWAGVNLGETFPIDSAQVLITIDHPSLSLPLSLSLSPLSFVFLLLRRILKRNFWKGVFTFLRSSELKSLEIENWTNEKRAHYEVFFPLT